MTQDTEGLDKLDPTSMTAAELYAALKEHGELIITIPDASLAKVKQDLANYKTRRSMADKELRLSYKVLGTAYAVADSRPPAYAIDVQIQLKGADLLPILNITRPSEM